MPEYKYMIGQYKCKPHRRLVRLYFQILISNLVHPELKEKKKIHRSLFVSSSPKQPVTTMNSQMSHLSVRADQHQQNLPPTPSESLNGCVDLPIITVKSPASPTPSLPATYTNHHSISTSSSSSSLSSSLSPPNFSPESPLPHSSGSPNQMDISTADSRSVSNPYTQLLPQASSQAPSHHQHSSSNVPTNAPPPSKSFLQRPNMVRFYSTPTLPCMSPTRQHFRLPNSHPRHIKVRIDESLFFFFFFYR